MWLLAKRGPRLDGTRRDDGKDGCNSDKICYDVEHSREKPDKLGLIWGIQLLRYDGSFLPHHSLAWT
jgi:hypothetical protein